MAEGATVSEDGRTWDIKLREGLKFHDGEPVLAEATELTERNAESIADARISRLTERLNAP